VLWHHLQSAAESALATTVEVGWALLEFSFRVVPTLAESVDRGMDVSVFAVGDGDDFDRLSP
jgi:hypothetical protein